MGDFINIVKDILDSDPIVLISEYRKDTISRIIDNRLDLVKKHLDMCLIRNNEFYVQLVDVLSDYVGILYRKNFENLRGVAYDKNEIVVKQSYSSLRETELYKITKASSTLANKLFDFICTILEEQRDLKISKELLKKLMNRDAKLFSVGIEDSWLFRVLDYEKLTKILVNNNTIKKSALSINDVYEVLIDSCQINNGNVVRNLIKPQDFVVNHEKIDELLMECNPSSFVELTSIIRKNLDPNFDRFSFIKKRNNNHFVEHVIINLLQRYCDNFDYQFIHQILTDPEIEIDYDMYKADYIGQTTLRNIIAIKGNYLITRDLLSKADNKKEKYFYGDKFVNLYSLYARIGDYNNAFAIFEKKYDHALDYECYKSNFENRLPVYTTYGFEDSLTNFIYNLGSSFNSLCIAESERKNLLFNLFKSSKIKYILLDKVLEIVCEMLCEEDFNEFLNMLMNKYNSGEVDFLTQHENSGVYEAYKIINSTEEEIYGLLNIYKKDNNIKLNRAIIKIEE